MESSLKKTIYKYCTITPPESFRRFQTLLEGRIYFSSPLRFNDPFELSAKIDISQSPFLYGLTKRESDEVSRLFRLANPEAVSNDWKDKVGILCLSENPLHILMWSHYAANHTGICIGFDTGMYPFHDAGKVLYSADRPRVALGSSPDELLKNVFLTKFKHWEYEEEWRIIKRTIEDEERDFYFSRYKAGEACLDEIANLISSNGGAGLYDFVPEAIRSIFLGARINSDTRLRLIDLVRTVSSSIKIFDIELDQRYFWLNKRLIK